MNRNRLLFNVLVALILGAALTLSSWVVAQAMPCLDVKSCAFATLGRGFPLPWLSEHVLPNIPPYHGGIETQLDFGGLDFDLAVWCWLSFVGLLLAAQARRERVESLTPTGLWFAAVLLGVALVGVGLFVALVIPPVKTAQLALEKIEYVPPVIFSLSRLGFSATVIGVLTAVSGYRKSTTSPWLTSVAAGLLIAFATALVPQLIGPPSLPVSTSCYNLTCTVTPTYGFPLGWFTAERTLILQPEYFDIMEWPFLIDALVWTSISAAILILASAARVRTKQKAAIVAFGAILILCGLVIMSSRLWAAISLPLAFSIGLPVPNPPWMNTDFRWIVSLAVLVSGCILLFSSSMLGNMTRSLREST